MCMARLTFVRITEAFHILQGFIKCLANFAAQIPGNKPDPSAWPLTCTGK